jgi:hypothetical protein
VSDFVDAHVDQRDRFARPRDESVRELLSLAYEGEDAAVVI